MCKRWGFHNSLGELLERHFVGKEVFKNFKSVFNTAVNQKAKPFLVDGHENGMLLNLKKMVTKLRYPAVTPPLCCQHQHSQIVPQAQLRAQFRTSCAKSFLFVQQSCISRAKVSFSSQPFTLSHFKSRIFDQYGKNDSVSTTDFSFTIDRLLFTGSLVCSGANGRGLFL